jgi:predicted Zn-dependent protease
MGKYWSRAASAFFLLFLACTTNPVTGRREFNLMSESQEIALGRESDPTIVATYGLYDRPGLAAYVDSIGQRLAAVSHRPNLPFTFRVLDSPVINAFALPGGYIYITRGILAYMNDEAELAVVLGHEIGHVTARHGANQYSRATLAGLGLAVGSVFSSEVARFSGLAETALGLLFLKYGRDDETQADELGVQYAVTAGWDAARGVDFFEVLDRQQQESGQSLPSWLSTHPAPQDRVVRTRQLASQVEGTGNLRVGEVSHKQHVEGIVFGDDPRQGFFAGNTFQHPDLRFELQFPSGWTTRNTPTAVLAVEPQQQARLQLTLEGGEGEDPMSYVRALAQGAKADVLGLRAEEIGGYDAALGEIRLVSDGQTTIFQIAAIQRERAGPIYQILGVGSGTFATWQPTFLRTMRSFGPLRNQEALSVQSNRLHVVRLERRQTLSEVAARTADVPVPVATLALLNNIQGDTLLDAGFRLKIVRGTYRPEARP